MSNTNLETRAQLVELNNLDRFTDIFEKCFGFVPPQGYFEWKYTRNPAGKLIAFEEINSNTNEVGAFYGITPEKYSIDGETVRIYQSMDTMTHPDYRNRGLFIKLAKMTYDYAYNLDGHLELIGIPGSNSYHGFVKKLRWKNPLDFSYIFQHRSIVKAITVFQNKELELEQIKLFDESTDSFFSNKSHYKSIFKIYDKDILNWKISQHPFNNYVCYNIRHHSEIIGILILQKEAQNMKIVYVDFLNKDYRTFLKAILKQVCKLHSFKYLYTWQSTDSNMAAEYKSCGLIRNPYSKGPFSYRVPLILLSKNNNINLKDKWEDALNFELQPIIQD